MLVFVKKKVMMYDDMTNDIVSEKTMFRRWGPDYVSVIGSQPPLFPYRGPSIHPIVGVYVPDTIHVWYIIYIFIYLHENHKNQPINVGEYTSPMDPRVYPYWNDGTVISRVVYTQGVEPAKALPKLSLMEVFLDVYRGFLFQPPPLFFRTRTQNIIQVVFTPPFLGPCWFLGQMKFGVFEKIAMTEVESS